MSTETWGLMPKSQSESTTIDEAITVAIADHEADPEAHQGEGESLQNHKSDEVIDHPASSVVSDKIPIDSVDPTKFDMTKYSVVTQFEQQGLMTPTTQNSGVVSQSNGALKLSVIASGTSVAKASLEGGFATYDPETTNPKFKAQVDIWYIPYGSVEFGLGTENTNRCTFFVSNNILYARTYNNTTLLEEVVPDIDLTIPHVYDIQVVDSQYVNYYVDDVLVRTFEPSFDHTPSHVARLFFRAIGHASGAHEVYVYFLKYIETRDI